MSRHTRLIELATRVAKTSEHKKWQLGAVMTRGSTFLGSAPNKYRNPPVISHVHATTHAEVATLRRCLLTVQGVVQSTLHALIALDTRSLHGHALSA